MYCFRAFLKIKIMQLRHNKIYLGSYQLHHKHSFKTRIITEQRRLHRNCKQYTSVSDQAYSMHRNIYWNIIIGYLSLISISQSAALLKSTIIVSLSMQYLSPTSRSLSFYTLISSVMKQHSTLETILQFNSASPETGKTQPQRRLKTRDDGISCLEKPLADWDITVARLGLPAAVVVFATTTIGLAAPLFSCHLATASRAASWTKLSGILDG